MPAPATIAQFRASWMIILSQNTIARHLLTVAGSVLTHREPYRHYSPERIAYKYLTWAWVLQAEERQGMTRQQFARYYLMRLGIGNDLRRVALNSEFPYRLASM